MRWVTLEGSTLQWLWLTAMFALGCSAEHPGEPSSTAQMGAECSRLSADVTHVLSTNCALCHSAGCSFGPPQGGPAACFDALDVRDLIDRDLLVPGEPQNSKLYTRLTDTRSPHPTPPDGSTALRLMPAELGELRAWISSCVSP